jgi:hypothetical protein
VQIVPLFGLRGNPLTASGIKTSRYIFFRRANPACRIDNIAINLLVALMSGDSKDIRDIWMVATIKGKDKKYKKVF